MARERPPNRPPLDRRGLRHFDSIVLASGAVSRKLAGCRGYVDPGRGAQTGSTLGLAPAIVVATRWPRRRPGSLPRDSLQDVRTMSDRPLSRIRQLVALCMLVAAVVTIGLAIAGALTGARSPVPQLASQK